MAEEPLHLAGGDYRLFAVLHRPDVPAPAGGPPLGWVCCPPFAEEKKGAHRLLVDFARDLCRRGIPVLRFDYRGTGDSEGSFSDFTLSGAVADTRHAMVFLQEQTGVREVGLLGVRLGGALAALAAVDRPAAALGLWEPITNGRRYMQMNLRQKRIREMMTTAEGQTAGEETGKRGNGETSAASPTPAPEPQDGYDFDGYWITPALNSELEALLFPKPAGGSAPARLLAVSVNAAGRVSRDLETLAETYGAAGTATQLAGVLAEPFWSLQDPIPVPELIQVTADWAVGVSG